MKKISLLIISVLLVGTSFLFYQQYQKDQQHKKQLQHQEEVRAAYQQVVSLKNEATLFNNEGKSIGKIAQGMVVELDAFEQNDYFKIKNQDMFVHYLDVQAASLPVYDDRYKNYIPFNESIVLEQASFYDVNDGLLFQVNLPFTFDILVKLEDAYLVEWQNQLVKIKSSDVKEIIKNDRQLPELATDVPVLMYHFFFDDTAGQTANDGNWISRTYFANHLDYFKEQNYLTLTMKETQWLMYGQVQLPKNVVAITIDDGDPSVFSVAEPELAKRDMHATVFLVTAWNGFLASESHPSLEFQSHSHDMHQGGCTGQHGGRILCIPTEEGIKDVQTSAEILKSNDAFCYPFGDFNDHAKDILRQGGYKMAFTVEGGLASPNLDPLELPRVRISTGTTVDYLKAKLGR